MPGKVIDFGQIMGDSRDQIAVEISRKYQEFEMFRRPWAVEKQELRNYLFATDTRKTANAALPWKNSTTVPKLTQIRDNLHANYMAALFPNEDWLQWEGDDLGSETIAKRDAITSYMRTKLRQSAATIQVSRLILDYIDNGNVFATAEWIDESVKDENGLVTARGYVGPKLVRISPFDIVFNPTVSDFKKTPKIIRSLYTLGDLYKEAQGMPPESTQRKMLDEALNKTVNIRKQVRSISQGDSLKSDGYQIDGFGSMQQYYNTDYVEILAFYGDIYDISTNTLLENHVITVMDRSFLVDKKPNPNWTAEGGIFQAGWRERPDNLYAMGPLDNLVGMQYRIDHLENLKADVFDLVAYPVLKIKGFVDDFDYEPGARIFTGDEGDVEFMHPDVTALNADSQIAELERRMEELAGAPREAMGMRTPGEKTKFEVQVLDNATSRIFQNKIAHFEKVFFEPLLNYMLQLARQNMSGSDVTRTLDSEVDAIVFSTITKDDLTANGRLHPEGASRFAERANALQNLIQVHNQIGQDPQILVHLSGKKMAQLIEELSGFAKYKLYGDNIRVIEEQETQRLQQTAQEQTQVVGQTPPGLTEGDPAAPQPV